jgi:DNA-binding LacI/PurR family transcriptional regulator
MLEQDSNFDGMVINGYNVTDKFLDSLARFKIPYMVFGYRDISARHPQLNSDGAVEDVRKKLCSIFLDKLRGRRMACLTGHGNNLSDRVALEGFRLAAADCGIITAPELICRCNNDGYYEFKRLYENERIEAVLLYGDPLHGYLRYFQEYPDKAAERPYCLVSSSVWREEAFALLPKLFDKIIFSSGRDMAIETTKKLFARILPADE